MGLETVSVGYFPHTVSIVYSATNGMDNVVMFSIMDFIRSANFVACVASHSNTTSS